ALASRRTRGRTGSGYASTCRSWGGPGDRVVRGPRRPARMDARGPRRDARGAPPGRPGRLRHAPGGSRPGHPPGRGGHRQARRGGLSRPGGCPFVEHSRTRASPAPRMGGSMDKLVVAGGRPLHGSVAIGGAKNSALKLMAAALLAPGRTVLDNVPRIVDCWTMAEVLEHL